MADAFSLKLQRNNRKNALAVDPATGKIRKKLYFSSHCGDETTVYYKSLAFSYGIGNAGPLVYEASYGMKSWPVHEHCTQWVKGSAAFAEEYEAVEEQGLLLAR